MVVQEMVVQMDLEQVVAVPLLKVQMDLFQMEDLVVQELHHL
tara:strand:+ start:304 stop:429 length:126 start_codon:yes stop_codon:yes gene_type:complete